MVIFAIKNVMKKHDKIVLASRIIKAATAIVGADLITSGSNKYLTLTVLALGAAANEVLSYYKEKEYKSVKAKQNEQPEA